MASSYRQLHGGVHRESPAKIFAKLKSNLQRTAAEDSADDEGPAAMRVSRVLYTPKRGTQTRSEASDFSLAHSFERGEVTAVTLSPISSPTKQNGTIANMPRHKHLMESTRCNQPAFQTHPHGHGIHTTTARTTDGFVVREAGDLENVDPPLFICSDSVFSPMKKRLRKRKCGMNTSNYVMSAVDYAHSPKKDRKISPAFREDDLISSRSAAQYSPQRRNGGAVETLPVNITPAKMFAYLKQREKLREQCDAPQRVTSSSRPEADWDCQSDGRIGTEPAASSVERLSPGDESSDEDFTHDAESEEPPPPLFLEDSVVLNSPRISIPKETVCRRTKWPHCITFPSENAVHLRKWFIQGRRKGLFVEGIHREKNIEWHSNLIAERISKSALKTVTGTVYILVGKMSVFTASPFPKWFLKNFVNGFPSNWKELHEGYLSESKGMFNKKPEAKMEKRKQTSKTSVRAEQLQSAVSSCPSSAPSIANVSRSGRVIKPPLDYWKGGRVIMDAHMNVTIHDSYNSSIIQTKDTPSVSTKSFFLKPDQLMSPVTAPVTNVSDPPLQRKIKTRPRKPRQSPNNTITKPSCPEYTTATTTRVTRSSTRSSGSGTNDDSALKEFKKPQKKATKANNVKLEKRSPPSANTTSSQPLKERSSEGRRRRNRSRPTSGSSNSSRERNAGAHKNRPVKEVKTRPKRRSQTPSPVASAAADTRKDAQPSRTHKRKPRSKPTKPANDEDEWTEEELGKLHEAVSCFPMHMPGYWAKVATAVGTRSPEECHKRHVAFGAAKTPVKYQRKAKVEPLKEKAKPVISAGVGTLRRKQQVRDFLETMAKDEMDDVFSSAYMQSKRFEVPSMCTSEHHDFTISNQEPITPGHTGFPEAKTPQCLHITPGMIGSSSRNCDDKYVFHLQKRMKNHYQFNVEKHAKKTNFTPVSVKKAMRRCGNAENDTFVVWEMFPEKEAQADSEEEEDVYFSEND